MTTEKQSRAEYQRAYYQANKERLNAAHKAKRNDATRANEERYREKKRTLKEIEEMPRGAWWSDAC